MTELQPDSLSLSPAIQRLLQQQLVESAVRLGAQSAPLFVAAAQQAASKVALPTAVQSATLIQPSECIDGGEIQPDATAFTEVLRLFQQVGVETEIAVQWAKHLTPGYQPDREISASELALIDRILSAPDLTDVVEAVPVTQIQPSANQPCLSWQACIFSDRSPYAAQIHALVMLLLFVASGWLLWQIAMRRAQPQPPRPISVSIYLHPQTAANSSF